MLSHVNAATGSSHVRISTKAYHLYLAEVALKDYHCKEFLVELEILQAVLLDGTKTEKEFMIAYVKQYVITNMILGHTKDNKVLLNQGWLSAMVAVGFSYQLHESIENFPELVRGFSIILDSQSIRLF